jgi:hypothetical protein
MLARKEKLGNFHLNISIDLEINIREFNIVDKKYLILYIKVENRSMSTLFIHD